LIVKVVVHVVPHSELILTNRNWSPMAAKLLTPWESPLGMAFTA
jgi:hypothetical protein